MPDREQYDILLIQYMISAPLLHWKFLCECLILKGVKEIMAIILRCLLLSVFKEGGVGGF